MTNLTDIDLARYHQFKFKVGKDLEPSPRVVSELDIVVYIYNHSEKLTYVYCVPHEYQPLLQQAISDILLEFPSGTTYTIKQAKDCAGFQLIPKYRFFQWKHYYYLFYFL